MGADFARNLQLRVSVLPLKIWVLVETIIRTSFWISIEDNGMLDQCHTGLRGELEPNFRDLGQASQNARIRTTGASTLHTWLGLEIQTQGNVLFVFLDKQNKL